MDDSASLEGLRVVAVATNVPGPLCAARFASLGATVTKIEPPGGDALEGACPQWYAEIVAAMRVVRLDLACSQATVLAEIANADVLITAMRPRALQRAHLDWASLHERFARLCQVEIVGDVPPHGDRPGHDLTYQAEGGILNPPHLPRSVFADFAAAERAFSDAMLALYERQKHGAGAHRIVAIAQCARELGAPRRYGLTSADGPLGGGFPAYAMYRASDGWIAIAALEPHFRERLQETLQIRSLERDALTSIFAQHDVAHWEALAERNDLPMTAVSG